MSEKFSSEFKAEIAIEAAAQAQIVIKKIAEKHGVSEEQVIAWASKLEDEAVNIFSSGVHGTESHTTEGEVEEVDISTDDDELISAVQHGVMNDNLNFKRLLFWTGLGTVLIVIFVISIVKFSQYSLFETQKEVSAKDTPSDIKELKAEQNKVLDTYGVVDLEEGIYRIPIDSAISRIAID
jgi:transposase-like protein